MSEPQKRGDRWRIRWVDADGNRKSKTVATFDLARRELRRLEVGVDEDTARRERLGCGVLTVTEAGERFLGSRKRDPNNTERRFQERGDTHRRHFDLYIMPRIGDVKLCDLTPAVLRRWVDTLAATKTARPGEKNEAGRTLSASSIRNIITTLRQIALANDVELKVRTPDSVKQKKRRAKPKALQCIEDVRALVAACSVSWFRIAVALSCYCGARLGEIASLRWRHIDRVNGTITIALSWEGPLKARYEDGSDAARTVPLDLELAELLESWRSASGAGLSDHVVLKNGRPLEEHGDDMAAKTRAACRRADVTPLTFHSLRATYGTIVARGGLPVGDLKALLGHQDVRTTAIYMRSESEIVALDPRATISGRSAVRGPAVDPAESASAAELN